MPDKPEYVYIMYPVAVDALKNLPFPLIPSVPVIEEDDFVPLWYGNAKFPEDEV